MVWQARAGTTWGMSRWQRERGSEEEPIDQELGEGVCEREEGLSIRQVEQDYGLRGQGRGHQRF